MKKQENIEQNELENGLKHIIPEDLAGLVQSWKQTE
jgi:hypothetical protein